MKKIQKKTSFKDARGTITDIFVGEAHEHCTLIFTKKGGVRGNHYHALSRQYDFLVSGKFQVYSRKKGEKKVTKTLWKPHELVSWDAGEAHEFIALEDSVWITFVDGVRGGDDFEKDTYRLETPLHSEKRVLH
ncbi:MAG: hypothetical protein AAB421_03290 [Patescibacteria group bacterium]